MARQWLKHSAPWIVAAILFTCASLAVADEINYNYYYYGVDPYGFTPPQYISPGDGISQPTDSGWLWTIPLEQQTYDPWEAREARDFHPGYATWDDYYASPPWKHQNRHDFNPWWIR